MSKDHNDEFWPGMDHDEWIQNDWESDDYIEHQSNDSGFPRNEGATSGGRFTLIFVLIILAVCLGSCVSCVHSVRSMNQCIVEGRSPHQVVASPRFMVVSFLCAAVRIRKADCIVRNTPVKKQDVWKESKLMTDTAWSINRRSVR